MKEQKKIKLIEGSVLKGGINLVSDIKKPKFTPMPQKRTSSENTKPDKLQLVYVRLPRGTFGCIPESHYDLCTLEKEPSNIACILTDKEGAKLIRKWIKRHNKGIENANKEN